MLKNYWNSLKDYYSTKTNRVIYFLLFLGLIFVVVFVWAIPTFASIGIINRLTISIMITVPFILILATAPLIERRRLKFFEGKDSWDIAKINFNYFAIALPSLIAIFIMFDVFLPLSRPRDVYGVEFLNILAFYAGASIIFFAIALLFKRRSPKAIVVGYSCTILLLILISVDLFVLNPFTFSSSNDFFMERFFLVMFNIQGIGLIYKASKRGVNPPSL